MRPNDRCSCGSGKKFKKCCMSAGMRNLTDEEWAERQARARRLASITDAEIMGAMPGELGVIAQLMASAPFQRQQQEAEERRQLEEFALAVDSIDPKARILIDEARKQGLEVIVLPAGKNVPVEDVLGTPVGPA